MRVSLKRDIPLIDHIPFSPHHRGRELGKFASGPEINLSQISKATKRLSTQSGAKEQELTRVFTRHDAE